MDRAALADFLRVRREALTPDEFGLPPGSRRRTPGLRREEVAQLTGMSVDYYTRLEQRRGPQPSAQMLSALARTLRFGPDERDHLYRLAGHPPPDRTAATSPVVRPALLHMLDKLDDCAAFVVSDIGVMLAQNRLSVLLMGDQRPSSMAGIEASMTWRWFTGPDLRSRYPVDDQERQGRIKVADLRATWSRRRGDADVEALLEALLAASEEFRQMWEYYEVAVRRDTRKVYFHPDVGQVTLDIDHLVAEGDQRLIVASAPPGSESYSKMRLLAVVGHGASTAQQERQPTNIQ
jgi:transcriptional regulator with XRE-family HTH domain